MKWSRLFWIAIPAMALMEVLVRSLIASSAPSVPDLEQAAQCIRDAYRPGDLVVVAPRWFTQARQALGSQVLPLADQAGPDLDTYERLWELSIRGARASESQGAPVELERTFGSVRVRRYALEPNARVLYDFVEQFHQGRVVEERDTIVNPCLKRSLRWNCGRDGRDEWIGRETISDLDHRPRRCIWAHPLPNGRRLRIEFSGISAKNESGSALRLDGHRATDYVVGRHCSSDPVFLDIEINGQVKSHQVHRDCEDWHPFQVDVPLGDGVLDFAFIVTAPQPTKRHFCFQAQLREVR